MIATTSPWLTSKSIPLIATFFSYSTTNFLISKIKGSDLISADLRIGGDKLANFSRNGSANRRASRTVNGSGSQS